MKSPFSNNYLWVMYKSGSCSVFSKISMSKLRLSTECPGGGGRGPAGGGGEERQQPHRGRRRRRPAPHTPRHALADHAPVSLSSAIYLSNNLLPLKATKYLKHYNNTPGQGRLRRSEGGQPPLRTKSGKLSPNYGAIRFNQRDPVQY